VALLLISDGPRVGCIIVSSAIATSVFCLCVAWD
jgi:hypothetical protein